MKAHNLPSCIKFTPADAVCNHRAVTHWSVNGRSPRSLSKARNAACEPNTAKLTAHVSIWLRWLATSHVSLTPQYAAAARAATRLSQCSWTGAQPRPADKHSGVPTSGAACCNSSTPSRLQPHVSCRHRGWQTDTHLHTDTPTHTRTHTHGHRQAC